MPIQIDPKRTLSYIGTFDSDSAGDMLELEELRRLVKKMNSMLKESGYDYRFRVSLSLKSDTVVDAYIHRRN